MKFKAIILASALLLTSNVFANNLGGTWHNDGGFMSSHSIIDTYQKDKSDYPVHQEFLIESIKKRMAELELLKNTDLRRLPDTSYYSDINKKFNEKFDNVTFFELDRNLTIIENQILDYVINEYKMHFEGERSEHSRFVMTRLLDWSAHLFDDYYDHLENLYNLASDKEAFMKSIEGKTILEIMEIQ